MGPCLCGDICCPSCGPAQGNYRCHACGRWESDGGCEEPAKCEAILKKMDEDEERGYLIDKLFQAHAKKQNTWVGDVDVSHEEIKRWDTLTPEQLRTLISLV